MVGALIALTVSTIIVALTQPAHNPHEIVIALQVGAIVLGVTFLAGQRIARWRQERPKAAKHVKQDEWTLMQANMRQMQKQLADLSEQIADVTIQLHETKRQ